MVKKIVNHHVTKKTVKTFSITMQIVLLVVLVFTVFTFVTSKTGALGSVRSMIVLTGSMEPTISVGSVVYVAKQIAYDKSNVITFVNDAGQNVTHRIADIAFTENGTEYTTKGDANKTVDTTAVPSDKVTGKVVFTIPYVGIVISKLNTPYGFLGFVILPTFIFIGFELWKIKKEIEVQTEKRILEKLQQQSQMSLEMALTKTSI